MNIPDMSSIGLVVVAQVSWLMATIVSLEDDQVHIWGVIRQRSDAAREQEGENAGVDIAANQREKLERLCRYVSRPPVASERMALTASGHVRYARNDFIRATLRNPGSASWALGTYPACANHLDDRILERGDEVHYPDPRLGALKT